MSPPLGVAGISHPIVAQVFPEKTAIGLQLNVPILNGFATRGRVQRAKINQERAEIQLKQAELDLERNVYQAYNDVKNAIKS